MQAVPFLQQMYAKYKHDGLEIVGLTYENGAGPQAEQRVREFARDKGITYHLAIGTPNEQRQVAGFRGYPTLLLFKRGLQLDRTEIGFAPESGAALEAWLRDALGLPPEPSADATRHGDGARAERPRDDLDRDSGPEPLPPGVVFRPGDGDSGFAFEVEDVAGRTIRFADLRGQPVVLALTSTWDGEAVATASLLNRLWASHGETGRVHVLAASLEIQRDPAAKNAAITAFCKQHDVRYRVFAAGLAFQKKVHLFAGMPLFLVFDAEGVLVLREAGASEKTHEAVAARLRELLGG